jgi:hypothetical protein
MAVCALDLSAPRHALALRPVLATGRSVVCHSSHHCTLHSHPTAALHVTVSFACCHAVMLSSSVHMSPPEAALLEVARSHAAASSYASRLQLHDMRMRAMSTSAAVATLAALTLATRGSADTCEAAAGRAQLRTSIPSKHKTLMARNVSTSSTFPAGSPQQALTCKSVRGAERAAVLRCSGAGLLHKSSRGCSAPSPTMAASCGACGSEHRNCANTKIHVPACAGHTRRLPRLEAQLQLARMHGQPGAAPARVAMPRSSCCAWITTLAPLHLHAQAHAAHNAQRRRAQRIA